MACVTLKLLGFLALLICLLEPLWSGQRARPGANYFAVLADNSQGMTIRDPGSAQSRGEVMRQLLTTEGHPWQGKLEETFQVRRYLFDSRLQFAKNFGELNFDGRVTSLGGALRTLVDRYRGQPLAGMLVFTDGNATDLAEGLSQLGEVPPVYPVLIGSDAPIKDLAVQKVTVTQTAFEDAPVTVEAEVAAVGYSGKEILGQLAEYIEYPGGSLTAAKETADFATENAPGPAGTNITAAGTTNSNGFVIRETGALQQTQKAPRDGEVMAFRFQVRPEKTGVRFYRLRVSAQDELGQFGNPTLSTEATLANNARIVAVDRGRGPYHVLYVSGRPNWEYKFLHRAVEADDQVQLAALIRIAKREPKMDFRGRTGESSNPLFRGFGNQSKEETEQYDQPVLRPIAADQDEWNRLVGGFPKTAEELYRYQAIILDDLEADFFTRDQMVLLQKFVSERGGGLLMLGGQESFVEGKFDRTPIGEMMPVYLDRAPQSKAGATYRLNLTREGWLQPWARLRNNEEAEKQRLEDTPPFLVLNQIREYKPGATVIAEATDNAGGTHPALVVQRYGNGRTAALLIGDMWHWGLKDKDTHRDMDKAWRQIVRWLIADVPPRIEPLVVQKPSDPDQAVLLQVRVRDEKFQPLDNASVSVFVQAVGVAREAAKPPAATSSSGVIRLTAEPALSEPGLYQTTYVPRLTGGYLADIIVTNAIGAEVGRSQAGWTSDPAAEEFRSLKPNRRLLEELARKTGGEMVPADRLDAFANGLPQRKVPIAESWTFPIWHQPAVFLLALACFVGEWGLRRWKGLA
jgi:uncharacterized membrane protein